MNIRIELPEKFHRALKKKAQQTNSESKRKEAKIIIMRELIKDGLVRPSKLDRQICGIED